ncbi:MAG: hypothetical protein KDI12_04455, partial [Anaerolineae bacterium]|nr:hypothetical protein [Anaerolineae bacterium]
MAEIIRYAYQPQDYVVGTRIAGTKAANGDNTLITAPAAGYRLVIKGWYVQNESATATTIVMANGTGESNYRYLAQNQG